ncbi:MAG: hypothetical protein R2744_05540 [Bacteroidales bacterium]
MILAIWFRKEGPMRPIPEWMLMEETGDDYFEPDEVVENYNSKPDENYDIREE